MDPFAPRPMLTPATLAAAGMLPTAKRGQILAAVQLCVVATFEEGDWLELASRLDQTHTVRNHYSLLKDLQWHNREYGGSAHQVLDQLLGPGCENLPVIAERIGLAAWLSEHDRSLGLQLYGPDGPAVTNENLAHLADPSAIREHLAALADLDPAIHPRQAIGNAKDLTESTVKLLLADLGEQVDKRSTLPSLVDRLHKALEVHPGLVDLDDPAAPAVRSTLHHLGGLAKSLAELRNAAGSGHGSIAGTTLTGTHVAALAVNTANTYCSALLAVHAQWTKTTRPVW